MQVFRCATLALFAAGVFAQTDRAILTGSVKDQSGAAIPEAKVFAVQTSTNTTATTVSTSTGDFTLPALMPGTYTLRVEKDGFKTFSGTGIILTAGGTTNVEAILQIGSDSESIEVTASAVQVQTENAKSATQVSNKMVDELPLVVGGAMRSDFDLALTAAQTNRTQGTTNQGNEADKEL